MEILSKFSLACFDARSSISTASISAFAFCCAYISDNKPVPAPMSSTLAPPRLLKYVLTGSPTNRHLCKLSLHTLFLVNGERLKNCACLQNISKTFMETKAPVNRGFTKNIYLPVIISQTITMCHRNTKAYPRPFSRLALSVNCLINTDNGSNNP